MHLEVYTNGRWRTAAQIELGPATAVTIRYLPEYFLDRAIQYDSRAEQAVSVNAPVSPIETSYRRWPALFDDLLPAGKARDWWLRRLGIQHLPAAEQQTHLLAHAVIAPVGNLRIKEAFAELPTVNNHQRFSMAEVTALEYEFLEFASNRGATVGGATGAHGVAPKLLLQLDDQESVLIDADFAGKPSVATPYLVKFARNTRSERDNNILRAEYSYYQVLHELFKSSAISTMNAEHIKLVTDPATQQSSLWLPRFDVYQEHGIVHRMGMESIYSILDISAGANCNHFAVIEALKERIEPLLMIPFSTWVTDYVIRDFLNVMFGNTDNHGRNISFLKKNGQLQLAPIYDFAPMKADPEFINRTFTWGQPFESGDQINYALIAQQLSDHVNADQLMAALANMAKQLCDLPQRLEHYNCPREIIEFNPLGFARIKQRLQNCGVMA